MRSRDHAVYVISVAAELAGCTQTLRIYERRGLSPGARRRAESSLQRHRHRPAPTDPRPRRRWDEPGRHPSGDGARSGGRAPARRARGDACAGDGRASGRRAPEPASRPVPLRQTVATSEPSLEPARLSDRPVGPAAGRDHRRRGGGVGRWSTASAESIISAHTSSHAPCGGASVGSSGTGGGESRSAPR